MGESLVHRGPDHAGHFESDCILLGNQRLAVIDVEQGNQPFVSEDGSIALVQNGEIYNYIELKRTLERDGVRFRTNSDTEVILRMYERYGVDFVEQLNGMFAIAIWDDRLQQLVLYRDRLGVKPLFYCGDGQRFIFASEIKSLLAAGIPRRLNHESLHHFLSFNYVPAPATIFEGVMSVRPGTRLAVDHRGVTEHSWWSLAEPSGGSPSSTRAAQDEILEILEDATRLRLRAEVEVGAFLSGGIDSSSVVAFASEMVAAPLKTFSIGFPDSAFDETPFAMMVSDRFGSRHTCRTFLPDDVSLWPLAVYHCDQPHGDVSFLPTYRVAQCAHDAGLKVVLTGDGADELFAGYEKYAAFFNVHESGAAGTTFHERAYFDSISLLTETDKQELYSAETTNLLRGCDSFETAGETFAEARHFDPINRALYFDTMHLLQGNNLVKPDRMGMAVSVEARSPYLDYRMVELAFRMPGHWKLASGRTKAILKDTLLPVLGAEIVERKKQMFTVPIGDWMTDRLAHFARLMLTGNRFSERNLFCPKKVSALTENHISGRENHTRLLRALIAIEIWHRTYLDNDAPTGPLTADAFPGLSRDTIGAADLIT